MKGFITRKGSKFKFLGNAVASKVLKGFKFYGADDVLREGTMPDNGAVSKSLNAGGSYTIPEGYHNGKGKVSANSLASQTDGTATAADILKDKTAVVDGVKITGTIATMSGSTITPGTSNQTIACSGKKMTSNIVVAGDVNLDPSNIKSGVSIFGVEGLLSAGLISKYKVVKCAYNATVTVDLTGWDMDKVICKAYYDLPYYYAFSYKLNTTSKTLTITGSGSSSSTISFTIVEWNCKKVQTVGGSFTGPSSSRTVEATPEATQRFVFTTQASTTNGYVSSVIGSGTLATVRGGLTIYDPTATNVALNGGGYYGDCTAYGIVLDL